MNPFNFLLRQRLYDDSAKDQALLGAIKLAEEIENLNPKYGGFYSGGEPFRYAYKFLCDRLGKDYEAVRYLLDLHSAEMVQD